MKVMVTGASGFIGRQVIAALEGSDAQFVALSSKPRLPSGRLRWRTVDLLRVETVGDVVHDERPTHLLHLAWNAVPGIYWTTLENLRWVESSLELLRAFVEAGGQRAVMAGTCAEYDWSYPLSVEDQTPTVPATLYGASKHALQAMLAATARQAGISSAWGRIFSLYGPYEDSARLVSGVISSLLDGKEALCGAPQPERDYLHVADVASAFVALLRSDIQGPVNIGSGHAVTIGEIASLIGEKIGRPDLVRLGARPRPAGDPDRLIADIARLTSTGWRPKFTLDGGLDDTIAWWRTC